MWTNPSVWKEQHLKQKGELGTHQEHTRLPFGTSYCDELSYRCDKKACGFLLCAKTALTREKQTGGSVFFPSAFFFAGSFARGLLTSHDGKETGIFGERVMIFKLNEQS